jgi:hypothetical protein
MMAIGNALTEEFIVEEGRVFTDHLARYRMPNITQTPEITSIVVEHPVKAGPYGANWKRSASPTGGDNQPSTIRQACVSTACRSTRLSWSAGWRHEQASKGCKVELWSNSY